ncbi:MAG: squalene synthase HpnC [Burkholderiaceae bacterium]
MSAQHYENFPVASWLCPPALRPAIMAIYAYARTADDLADEGDATPAQRLVDLNAYREDLRSMWDGRAVSSRWAPIFEALRSARRQHDLPLEPLTDLLSAFEQDLNRHRYADRAALLDYCRRSANPIGRLLLHLHGITDAPSLRRSDAICTALQLANFWQDLGIDLQHGRVYVPQTDCDRHGVAPQALLAKPSDGPPVAPLVAELVDWTRELMHAGAPLAGRIAGRAGWELRFVVQGGLRILDKIEQGGFDPRKRRPRLHWHDGPRLAWRAWRMPAAPIWPRPRSA